MGAKAGSVNVEIGATFAGSFKAAFGGAEKALGKLGGAVKDLDGKLQRVKGFQTARQSAIDAEGAWRQADQELRSMSQHLAGLGTISDKQAREFKALEKRTEAARVAMERARGDADRMERELREAGQSTSNLAREQGVLERSLQSTANRMKGLAAITGAGVGKAIGEVGSKLRGLATEATVAGIGLGYFFKSQFVDVASEFERFQTILETTEGSAAAAKRSMSWISDFAAQTPFDLAEVTDAFVKLRAYGLDPTTGLLRTLGDTGAAMGKPVMQAVEAIADAVTGENERLKEFGIKGSKKGGKVTYEYTDKAGKQQTKTVDANNRKLIESTLTAIWNEKYSGAMQKLSGTWAGMVSNLGDQWTRFTNNTMNAGLFEWMKSRLSGALDQINAMAADGRLQAWAESTGKALTTFAQNVWELGSAVVEGTKWLADFVGGWRNLGFILLGLKLAPLVVSVFQLGGALLTATGGLIQFATGAGSVLAGLRMLGAFMLTNPIGIALTALGVAAVLLWQNWDVVTEKLTALWQAIKTTAISAFDAVKSAVGSVIDWLAEKTAWIFQTIDRVKSAASSVGGMIGVAWDGAVSMVTGEPAAPVPAAGGGASYSSSVNAPITINGATDPNATARAVRAELDKRERERAANRRGAMSDSLGY